jgi:hypothetical protein
MQGHTFDPSIPGGGNSNWYSKDLENQISALLERNANLQRGDPPPVASSRPPSPPPASLSDEDRLRIIVGYFRNLPMPACPSENAPGFESMLDILSDVIANARAGRNGFDLHKLEKACRSMDEHGRRLNAQSKLSPSLIATIGFETLAFDGSSPHEACNAALREKNHLAVKPYVPYIWHLLNALAKCAPYVDGGNVYRGIKGDFVKEYPTGREVIWSYFISCTCDMNIGEAFCVNIGGSGTLFSIELTSGRARDISEFSMVPREREILLPPNSRFKVMSNVVAENGLTIINLKELPPLEPILDFNTGLFVSSFFQSSSQAPPVDPTPSPQTSGSKLSQAQVAAALAAVSQTRGKPILRSRISFVGEGAAGKTSVIRAICREADNDPASTIGIDRSCAEFDLSAVNVEAKGGEVRCSRRAQLIAALFVACALKEPAVEHESVCRHSIQ